MPYFLHSESGHNHKNEDSIAVQGHPTDVTVLLCALADGQGGQFGGALASQVAVEKCLKLASSYSARQLLESTTWYGLLSGADEAVSDEEGAGYTTLIGLCIVGDKLCGASCGDSAVLLINSGKVTVLTENQRKNPPVASSAASPVAFSATLQAGYQVLMMSDGVWKHVDWDAIISLCSLKRGEQLVSTLRQLSLENNAGKLQDDFSIAVLF